MKFTISWLKDYLDTNATLKEICDGLNRIGLEVENIEDKGEELRIFKSVLIEKCEAMTDSDHLNICKVDTGSQKLQIVCGAPNVYAGMKTILAPVGSMIPSNQLKIKETNIRGIKSMGMLCSEKELSIGEGASGIIDLDKDIEVGVSLDEIYGLNDPIIEIAITPNRGDCLGIYGIARDLSAIGLGKLLPYKDKWKERFGQEDVPEKFKSPIKIKINDKNCGGFASRYIRGVKNCESPKWMRDLLSAIGLTPKSALVDITNWVMFCMNKPLHCYDADKIEGDINIRPAKYGEKFLSLKDIEYSLDESVCLIADDKKGLCIGGVIGGKDSASTLETQNVLLESAIFDEVNIAMTGRKYSIDTDSRYRFERQIDVNNIKLGLDQATHLILHLCGGEASEIEYDGNIETTNRKIAFDINDFEKLIGISMDKDTICNILMGLGFVIEESKDILNIAIPSWRNDISIKEDIIEEIIRIYGYDNLKAIDFGNERIGENEDNLANKDLSEKLSSIRKVLTINGMDEVISWSFINKEIVREFREINKSLELIHPISMEMNYMRPTIIPSLLKAISNNEGRGFTNISLFEEGRVFLSSDTKDQFRMISGVRYGKVCKKDFHNEDRSYDVFDVKYDLLSILSLYNIKEMTVAIDRSAPDYYHPNKSGAIRLGNVLLGYFGEISLIKSKFMGIKNSIFAFELFLENIPQKKTKSLLKKAFNPSDFQSVDRSFSFIVNKSVNVGDLVKEVVKTNRELIVNVSIFDIYEGDKLDADQKSIAFSVNLKPKDKTFTGDEIDEISSAIITAVSWKFEGILRDK